MSDAAPIDEKTAVLISRLAGEVQQLRSSIEKIPGAIAAAVAAEREACAKIAESGVDEEHGASTVSANRRGLMIRTAREIRARGDRGAEEFGC